MKKAIIFILLLIDYVTSWFLLNCVRSSCRGKTSYHQGVQRLKQNVALYDTRPSIEYDDLSSIDRAFRETAQQFASIYRGGSGGQIYDSQNVAQQVNVELVKRATIFQRNHHHTRQYSNQQQHIPYPHPQRVPGCVANVQLQITLVPVFGNDDDGDMSSLNNTMDNAHLFKVEIQGDADALISKGLLATLATIVSYDSVFAHHILQVDPTTVVDQLGLRPFLSSGRNDGLASMTRVIQRQIRTLLHDPLTLMEEKETDFTKQTTIGSKEDPDNGSISRPKVKPTVAMLLSGGVDSSVALHLLLQQNYNVTAFYLKIWLEDELAHLGQCPWEDDYTTCQLVCDHAGQMYGVTVPLESISLQKEYKDRVISYTVHEAKKGRTPNPDIMCNSRVKFGCFYDAIEGRGFDYVATGHYAMLASRTESRTSGTEITSSMALLQAPDPIKDQTYFLSALTQNQLQRVLFPVGSLQKTQVRALASELNLPNKDRRDSQGLCFLGKVKFDEFLEAYLGHEPGDIIDAHSGEIIGRHNGLWFHTVGQRKGIGKVLNPKATSMGPWYVVAKDPQRRIVFASNQYDEDMFTQSRSEFNIEDIHWIAGQPPSSMYLESQSSSAITSREQGRFMMKIRHGSTLMEGLLVLTSDIGTGHIRLDKKDKGLAPGQYVVFYSEGECLGSGVISESHWNDFSLKA